MKKVKYLSYLQFGLLLIGTIFSGWALINEALAKPWLSVCFYGFLMFLLTALIAGYILRAEIKRKLIWQKRLLGILSIATLFSGVNFILTACSFYNYRVCPTGSCITNNSGNPFLTPCFYGAVLFLFSLGMAVKLYKRLRRAV